jgi:hypothetical protein
MESAYAAAIEFVNQALTDQQYPEIRELSELTQYRDVPCEPITHYCHSDDLTEFLVNTFLANVVVPAPVDAEPVFVGGVSQADLIEITAHIDLDSTMVFMSKRKVLYLSSLQIGGRLLQVSNRNVDEVFEYLLRGIRLPLESDTLECRVVREIVNVFQFNDLVNLKSALPALCRYDVKDNHVFLEPGILHQLFDGVLDRRLPVALNRPGPSTAHKIIYASDLLEDIFENVSRIQVDDVENFEIADDTFAANSLRLCDEWLKDELRKAPFIENACSDEILAEILVILNNFDDILPMFATPDVSVFTQYDVIDERFYIASACQDRVAALWSGVGLHLESNLVTDQGVEDILSCLHLYSVSELAHAEVNPFDDFTEVPTQFFKNQMVADEIFDSLWNGLGFPVCPNVASLQEIAEIIDFSVVACDPNISELKVLLDFELDQSQADSAAKIVDEMIEQMLTDCDSDLPLCWNLMRTEVAAEILIGSRFFCYPGSRDLDVFEAIMPCERRIAVKPPTESVIADVTRVLPVIGNICTVDLLDDIVNCLGPMSFVEFNPQFRLFKAQRVVRSLLMCALAEIVPPLIAEVEASGAEGKLGVLWMALKKKLPPPTIAKLVGRDGLD